MQKNDKVISLAMKLTLLLIFASLFQVSASVFSQQTKIDIRAEQIKISKVLESIEKKLNYNFRFIYNTEHFPANRRISIDVKDTPLSTILNQLLENTGYTFKLLDKDMIVFTPENVIPQLRRIEGFVTATNGEPLPGVSIRIKGTDRGAVTDAQGHYYLDAPDHATLVVSYIGYVSREVSIDGNTRLDISLNLDASGLDEVVVVGYGTQKRSDLTGSIASVSAAEIQQTPVVSLENILRGRTSGVQVTATSYQPGGGTTIRIRGNNSVNTGSEPLYVIDGFPVYNDNAAASAGATVGPRLNALSLINPDDIIAIEVLKDASATAIYGARGANGVVLVTTRKGAEGKTKFDFNAYYGGQEVRKTIPVLNATDFALLVNDANDKEIYSPEQIATFGEGTNWQDQVFRKAPIQNYQLSATGGDAKTKYALSLNFYDQQGIVINSDFKRLSARFNFEKQATDHFSYGSNFTFSRIGAHQALSATGGGEGTIGVVQAALSFSPLLPVYNEDGSYVLQSDRGIPMGNPVATALELTNKSFSYRTLGNIFAEYHITDGLRFRTSVGADILNNKEKYYAPRTTLAGYNVKGLGTVGSVTSYSWLNENTLTYDKTFDDHAITLLAGFTIQKYERELNTSSASGFINDLLGADNLGSGAVINAPTTNTSSWSLVSWLGRANYGFQNKLLVTLTGRVDGSSKLGANFRYGFFPSGALAYKFTEEDFIKNLNFFSDLKLRAGYGRIGNQEIDSYQSIARLSSVSYIVGNNVVKGFSTSNISNPDLKWESTSQYDIGADIGLFKGRLNLTADWYYKKTSDMLLWTNVPWSSGFSSALQNIGNVENKGFELGVQATILDKEFQWTASANISFNKNKVLSLGPVSEILTGEINGYLKISDPVVIRPGHSINSFYGYLSDGIFQLDDDIANSPQPNAVPGDRKYKDWDHSGTLDAKDRTYIGNAQPTHFGGMNHSFSYKHFDVNLFFNWVYGNDILNSTRTDLDLPTGQKNSSIEVKDRWTPENPSNTIPRASLNRSFLFSDAQLEDGSYLRLNTATIGYHFSNQWLRQRSIDKLRIYVSALNLWTLTSYSGYDPEANQSGQNNILRGIDSDSYPSAKTFLVGINLSL